MNVKLAVNSTKIRDAFDSNLKRPQLIQILSIKGFWAVIAALDRIRAVRINRELTREIGLKRRLFCPLRRKVGMSRGFPLYCALTLASMVEKAR
jgi:hypothetical protein